ncbi:MAG TPA: hypothetical protein PKE63_09450 [Lacibacter sp.]|nr:hypothetical protein [Lacibacter sp.]HMO88915.1 hypothetical protein [Lacibacter sp.]HMP87490.1 hypothetical protein [Lacibacter sp.]
MIWHFFYLLLATASAGPTVVPEQYLLYHVNRKVIWVHDGKKETARRGIFVRPQHSLQIAANAEAMLIGNDGRSMLLKSAGLYSFSQIKNRFKEQKNTGVVSSFFAYVFEKFLKEEEGDHKQKITAAVFRAPQFMQQPADSSFAADAPVTLTWRKQGNTPMKLEFILNDRLYDTVLQRASGFPVPLAWMETENVQARLVRWKVYPADSRQHELMAYYSFILPLPEDAALIRQQLQQLRTAYGKDPALLRMMERDLFERWLELYQLQRYFPLPAENKE